MRRARTWLLLLTALSAPFLASTAVSAQDSPFRWVDFHNEKDQDIIVWVTRALGAEKWTSIREIGVLYDAALVVTSERSSPQASPAYDTFHVWSVSLTTHARTPLLAGANLRWLDWMQFSVAGPKELGLLFDDCTQCSANTYFTAIYYDLSQHIFAAHWMRGAQAVPLAGFVPPEGVAATQVDALLSEPSGRQEIVTWSHFDYGKEKPAEDYLYRYDRDPLSGLERTELLTGKEADTMKQRLCLAQSSAGSAWAALDRGQDSALCQETVHPRAERRPVTTPPPNNRGKSTPPTGRH